MTMKNLATLTVLAAFSLMSCETSRVITSSDDVYARPAEEKKLEQQAAAEKARQEAIAAEKERSEMAAASKAAEPGNDNKYYKDPEYRAEDYYDYEYASRINRFYNPIGVGYYDNYYTNMYTYNQNPMMYGTSIYSSYGYGMPSQQFSSISFGISTGYGYGYGSRWNQCGGPYYPYYDPWCSSYMYSPWGYNNWAYNNWGYMNGYNQGYYQGYNNAQWAYYNRFDANSGYGKVEYGPRGSNMGGNSRGHTNPGMQVNNDSPHQRYIESVAAEQDSRPRFSNSNSRRIMRDNSGMENANPSRSNGGVRIDNNNQPVPDQRPDGGRNRNNNRVSNRQQEPVFNDNSSRREPVFNNSNSGNNSGTSSPRHTGGGGEGRRPR
jgi:hypothetical protein